MINDLEEKTDDKIKMPQLVEVVEEAVLMGARGNSGTILSQVITGFLKGTGDKVKLLPKDGSGMTIFLSFTSFFKLFYFHIFYLKGLLYHNFFII